MKRFVFCLFLVLSTLASNAREPRFRYQGEAVLGYTFCLEDDTNNINLEIVNGIRFSRYLFAGAGIGISQNFSDEGTYFPLYVNVKAHLPVSSNLELMPSLNAGTKIDYMYGTSGGLLLQPEFGVGFRLSRNLGINIALRYEIYSWRINDAMINSRLRTNQIGLRVGFTF